MNTAEFFSTQIKLNQNMNNQIFCLKLKIEPWVFENLREHFPAATEKDFQEVSFYLSDCINKFQEVVAQKILLGTEIMLDFMDGLLIFEIKNHTQTIVQEQVEETYTLDLSKVESN